MRFADKKRPVRMFLTVGVSALLCLGLIGYAFARGTPEVDEPVTITYLSSGSAEVEQAHDQKWVDEFNRIQDEIYVDYQLTTWAHLFDRLYADLGAGNPPDVVWYGHAQINDWMEMGILEPVNNWVSSDLIAQYLPHISDESNEIVRAGNLYGAPFTQAARAFVVRRDWLEEAGYPPEDIRTWDVFMEAARAVYDPARGRYATAITLAEDRMVGAALHHYYAPAFGLRNAVDFRDEMRGNYIEMLTQLQELGQYMPPAQEGWTHRDSIISYTEGVVAIAPQGSYFQGDLAGLAPRMAQPDVTAILPIPTAVPGGRPHVSAYTVGYTIMAASRNKEAAGKFIEFMADRNVAVEWAMNVSPHSGVTIDDRVDALGEHVRWWEEEWGAFFGGLVDVDLLSIPPYSPTSEIDSIKAEVIGDLLFGRVTPEAAYEELRTRITRVKEEA